MLKLTLPRKLYALLALAGLSLIVLSGIALHDQYRTMLAQRMARLAALTDAASGIVGRYQALVAKSEMTEAAARTAALADITAMRYGTDGYFFVLDEKAVYLAHVVPAMIGRD